MKTAECIGRFDLIRPGERVLCALSGGADSVCMTHALALLREKGDFSLAAAHFSHGIRPADADRERELCRRLCERLDIPLFTGEGDAPALAREKKIGLEDAARRLRRAFLTQRAESWHASRIALGHHREDSAETLLMNLCRGCGERGLRGLPPREDIWIRPLLLDGRGDIEDYCRAHHLAYAVDPGNRGTGDARSALRNTVFPLLDGRWPGAAGRMAETALALWEGQQETEARARALLDTALRENDALSFDRAALLAEAGPVQARTLQLAQQRLGGEMLSRPQLEGAGRILTGSDPGAGIDLAGTRLHRRYEQVLLTVRREAEAPPEPVLLTGFGSADFGPWQVAVIPDGGEGEGRTLPRGSFDFPLTLRSRRAGDGIALKNGTKSVKKLLIEAKIPKDLRDTTPILCDNNRILAVGGLRTAYFPAGGEEPRVRVICRRKEI